MAGEWLSESIESLIENGVILAHKDGNYGSSYPRKSEFGDEGVLFLTAKHLDDSGDRIDFGSASRLNFEKAKKLTFGYIEENDVLLSHNATVGRVAVVPHLPEPVLVGTSLTYYRVDASRLLPGYLASFFRGRDFQNQLAAVMSHSTRNQVPITAQRKLNVTVPPIEEQRAIASILGALDDKIELNRRMNATLESLARAIFKSWFVDFDPVRSKSGQQAEPPSGTGVATATSPPPRDLSPDSSPFTLPPSLSALFPSTFQDSDLGMIPTGWEVGTLSSVADVIMGTSPKSSTYNEHGEGTPLVNGPVEFGNYFPVKRKWTTAPTRFSESSDLIFCVRGSTTGRRVHSDGVYCLGRGVCSIRSKNGHQAYVNQTIEYELPRMLSRVTGSVFPNLSAPQIKGFEIVVPGEKVLSAFSDIMEPIEQKVASNVLQSLTLSTLRDALLPKLLSGELPVPVAKESLANG